MTVKELREALDEMPDDAEVVIEAEFYWQYYITNIILRKDVIVVIAKS